MDSLEQGIDDFRRWHQADELILLEFGNSIKISQNEGKQFGRSVADDQGAQFLGEN